MTSNLLLSREISACLETLLHIQDIVGVRADPAAAEKMALEAFKGDEFMGLKYRMMKRMEATQEAVTAFQKMDGGSLPPPVKIKKQQEIRETLKKLEAQWDELNALYRRETNKSRSKLGQHELGIRAELKETMKEHIDALKEDFLQAYGGGASGANNARRPLQNFEAFKKEVNAKGAASGGAAATEQELITGEQEQRLQQIEMRNMQQDQIIAQIGDGVDRLNQMALAMGDEVAAQAGQIKALEADVDVVVEHVGNINAKMKETLQQIRDSDRFCMDVLCMLLFLGMLGLFVNMLQSRQDVEEDDNSDDDDDDD